MDYRLLRDYPEAKGWKALPKEEQDWIINLASHFHYRDAVRNEDGSMGTTKITHHQLLDILALALQHNR